MTSALRGWPSEMEAKEAKLDGNGRFAALPCITAGFKIESSDTQSLAQKTDYRNHSSFQFPTRPQYWPSQSTLFLDPLKELYKVCWFLRSTNLKLVLDREVGYARNALLVRILDLFVHFWTSLAALQPLLNLSRIQARLDPGIDQDVMRSDILLIFEIRSEKLLDHSCLDGWRFCFAKLNKTMRIPRIAGFSAELKVDTVASAQLCKTLLHI